MAKLSSLFPRGVRRLFRLPPSRERIVRDLDDEVRVHLTMRIDELRALGMSDADARSSSMRIVR